MSQAVVTEEGRSRQLLRRTVLGGAVGTFVEFYEFSIYAVLATTFAAVFFPEVDPTVGLLSSLAVFAVAFFARPLGGFVWGAVGDRVGRKRVLSFTVILMSGCTAAMGLLPGYASIGALAPFLLIVLRFLQGFAAGGEMSGAVSFIAEHAPVNRRGFNVGMIQIGAISGALVGSVLPGLLLIALSAESMETWGWRIPLVLALPMGITGLWIRRRLEETPQFIALRAEHSAAHNPVAAALTGSVQRKLMWKAFWLIAVSAASFYLMAGYLPSFAKNSLGLTGIEAFAPSVIALSACIVVQFVGASLADRIGRKPIAMVSVGGLIVLSWPSFVMITSNSFALMACGLIIIGALVGGYASVTNTILAEMFPTRVRVTGHGISYNLSVALFGGSAPYLLTWLGGISHSNMVGAIYVTLLAAVTLGVLFTVPDMTGRPLKVD
ncbi:MFS transporter [Rhodococcus sp. NPDC057529]|uniref:MFS transporter n=1 Tax=Rhodococcus sp. NPDC057529 TaxID=3346158 RepID=UPI00366CD402